MSRDVALTLIGALLGWAVSHGYLASLNDLRADAAERARVEALLFRGIESVGTISYHRDSAGKVIGVTVDLQGGAAGSATATGTLTDALKAKE